MLFFKRRRLIKRYLAEATEYLDRHYHKPFQDIKNNTEIKKQHEEENRKKTEDNDTFVVKFSLQSDKEENDLYDADKITSTMRQFSGTQDIKRIESELNKNLNQTFVDRLLLYLLYNEKKTSDIYKAAQIDKRLFSKIISDREYKPSKDTAISLALALELSFDEASDFISRAGFAFSHSNKRDVIIEYFFREQVYDLFDINDVLYSLNLKQIGRY